MTTTTELKEGRIKRDPLDGLPLGGVNQDAPSVNEVRAPAYPQVVSIYPMMGIQAARRASGMGGGWRLSVLAKALDTCGLGMIRRDDLRNYVLFLGVNPRTWERWITEARNHDMVKDIQKGADWWLILPSAGRVALAMGMDDIGNRKATMSASALIGNGWKARVYSAWGDRKQISRERIQKTLNISVSSQRYRDVQAGTKRERNYAKSAMRSDHFSGVVEYGKYKAPFVMRDGFIAWRLPDTRFSVHAERAGKGRARKANKLIKMHHLNGLSHMRQALSDVGASYYVRLFNLTEAQRKATEKKIAKHDKRINELYQRAHEAKSGAVVWAHCPMV